MLMVALYFFYYKEWGIFINDQWRCLWARKEVFMSKKVEEKKEKRFVKVKVKEDSDKKLAAGVKQNC